MDLIVSEETPAAENVTEDVNNNSSIEDITSSEANIKSHIKSTVAASSVKATDSKCDHAHATEAHLSQVPDKAFSTNKTLNALKTCEIEVPYFDMSLSESGGSDHELNKEIDDAKPCFVVDNKANVDSHQARTFTKSFKPLPPTASGRSRRKAAEAAMIILQTLSDDDDEEIMEVPPSNKQVMKNIKSELGTENPTLGKNHDLCQGTLVSEIAVPSAAHYELDTVSPVIKLESVSPSSSATNTTLQESNLDKITVVGPQEGRASESELESVGGSYVPSESSDYLPSDEPRKKGGLKGKATKQRSILKKHVDSDSDYRPDDEYCNVQSDLDASGSSWDYDYDKDPPYIKSVSYEDCICEVCRVNHSNRSMCKLYSAELKTIANKTGDNGEPLCGSSSLPEVLDLLPGLDADSWMVVAKKTIAKFTVFGPLVGEEILVYAIDPDSDLTCMWVVLDDEDKVTCYSTANEDNSNWARSLTPSCNRREANVMAVSKEKNMYFVTIGDIEPKEPLLVWQDEHAGLALWTKRQHRDLLNASKCFRSKVVFPTPFHLRMHFMIYHDLRKDGSAMRHKTFCHICNESLLTSVALTEHCDKLHGQRPWKCGLCHKFLPKPDYRGHLRYCRQNPKRETVLCQLCSRDCLHPQGLRNHMTNMHSGVRQYTCEYCGKQFAMERGLSRHIFGVHHKKQPHVCDQCGKRFSQNANLKVHMLTHSGKKPFQCAAADCTIAYTTKQCLQAHYRRAHKYTDENMPEIIRTIAFTFEDYATRSGKVTDSDENVTPKHRRSVTAKQSKARVQKRGKKSQMLSSSDEDDTDKSPASSTPKTKKANTKKSAKNKAVAAPKRYRKSTIVSPTIGLEAESIPQIVAMGEDACFEQGWVELDASIPSKSSFRSTESKTDGKEKCSVKTVTTHHNDGKFEGLSSLKKEPGMNEVSTILTDSSAQDVLLKEIKVEEVLHLTQET